MMKKRYRFSLVLSFIVLSFVAIAQNPAKYSFSAGMGYWADIEGVGFEVGSNNPRMKGVHGAVGSFIEFNYRLKTDYWIGFKYLEADVLEPVNDYGKLFWDKDKMISFDTYALVVKRSFNWGNHFFDVSGGPLLHDYNGSNFSYDEHAYTDLNGEQVAIVLNPSVRSYHFIDFGVFLALEYKYKIKEHMLLGVKSDTYGLLNIGKQAITVMPVLEFRF